MRNIIKIAVALLIMATAVPMRAQEWEIQTIPADELRNIESDTFLVYQHKEGKVFISQAKQVVVVTTENGIFDISIKNDIFATVGLYDGAGVLVEKLNFLAFGSLKDPTNVVMKDYAVRLLNKNHPENHKTTRMIDFLKHNVGSVRIILPRYRDSYLDIKIPCMKNG